MTKQRWILTVTSGLLGLLIVVVTGGALVAQRAADDDGNLPRSPGLVSRIVENIGLETEVVREAIDHAKKDIDSGAARSEDFAALVAENLGLETGMVEDAINRARRNTLDERMQEKLESAVEQGRIDRARADELLKQFGDRSGDIG